MLPTAIPDATRRPSFRTVSPNLPCRSDRVTPAALPKFGPVGQPGCVEAERNQNLSFSATLHEVHKSDNWD